MPELRFIIRDGEKVLQYKNDPSNGFYGKTCLEWEDVPIFEERPPEEFVCYRNGTE